MTKKSVFVRDILVRVMKFKLFETILNFQQKGFKLSQKFEISSRLTFLVISLIKIMGKL